MPQQKVYRKMNTTQREHHNLTRLRQSRKDNYLQHLFKSLENEAVDKINHELISRQKEFHDYLNEIRDVQYSTDYENDIFKTDMIDKWNVDFHKRMPDGYYIQDDCWNIIKMFIFDYTIIGCKKLRKDKILRLGWYVKAYDVGKMFKKHKSSCCNNNSNIMYGPHSTELFIDKFATNEEIISNKTREPTHYWNLCPHADTRVRLFQIVKINKKTIKVNIYNYTRLGDKHYFVKKVRWTTGNGSDYEPILCRINKNSAGEQNYKTNYYNDYYNLNNNNACFNLSNLYRIDKFIPLPTNRTELFEDSSVSQLNPHATIIQQLYRDKYMELKPFYKKQQEKNGGLIKTYQWETEP